MPKGMRVLGPGEVDPLRRVIEVCRWAASTEGFQEIQIPSVWEQDLFVEKAGPEILNQMYTFEDKGGRKLCLIPEVTAIVQDLYRSQWEKSMPKPIRVFYVSRCYRYERPQAGRYREFTQFGIEVLGGEAPDDGIEVTNVSRQILTALRLDGVEWNESVARGLDYYVEDGFEVEAPWLGAQKQVLGGGRYAEGIGMAVGVDRLALAVGGKQE